MKPVMFLPALFVTLAVIGCQENQLVDPMSATTEKSAIARHTPINKSVEFSYTVASPFKSPDQLFLEVTGQVQFELRESPILSRESYDLVCYIDGEVYSQKFEKQLGSASITTLDNINFTGAENGEYVVLQKSMEIKNSNLPFVINMKLVIYRDRIEVPNVWLTTFEVARN